MADYPASIPNFSGLVGGAASELGAPSLPTWANKSNDEVVALATELGTDVAGAFTDLKTRLAFPKNEILGLEDSAATTLDTWEQWGLSGDKITFSGITVPVVIKVWFKGELSNPSVSSTRRIGSVQIEVSTDGETSWKSSETCRIESGGADNRTSNFYTHLLEKNTPTGDVVVRAMHQQVTLGTAGDISFLRGNLLVEITAQ